MQKTSSINWLSLILFWLLFVSLISGVIVYRKLVQYRKKSNALEILYEDQKVVTGVYKHDLDFALILNNQLGEELDVMTQRADQVASLDATNLILSASEIHDYIDMVPTGNPFNSDWYITSRFGSGKGYQGNPRIGHKGQDIVPFSSDWFVHPIGEGRVVDIGINEWEGKWILIEHNEKVRTRYMHLNKIYYEALPGEQVTVETKIGIMGSTGNSDGAHLHLQIELFDGLNWIPIDPYPFVEGERE